MDPAGAGAPVASAACVIAAVLKWSEDFIEEPHEIFGGLPVCPFARAARLKKTIGFEVRPFALDDPLDEGGELLSLVGEFGRQEESGELETLFVIHPDPAQPLQDLELFVQRLNARLAGGCLRGFQAFEAHPRSNFRVGDVYTRRSPYPSFQVLSRARLKSASDALKSSDYYRWFTPDMLRAVGMPR
jgi:hypothetical protein